MNIDFEFFIIIVIARVSNVLSFPEGPPDELHPLVSVKNLTIKNTCVHMDPSKSNSHGIDGKQDGISPFHLTVDKKVLKHTESLILTIRKRPNSTLYPSSFKGFIVQGRNQETEETIGDFIVVDDDLYTKKMHCYDKLGSAVSHKNAELKSELTLEWKPPKLDKTTCVKFYATVLVEKKIFWVKKAINLVQVEKYSSETNLQKSNFTCSDVDCDNDCFLNYATSLKPIKLHFVFLISIVVQLIYR